MAITESLRCIEKLHNLCLGDLIAVNTLISNRLETDIPLIHEVSQHIINSGGKRLRPLLVLLTAGAAGYKGPHHIDLAAVIECIHTATLLHDDVVDDSTLRRGKRSAHILYGNKASILVGDFLYSRAFQIMAGIDDLAIMHLLADVTNTIAQGEVLQLMLQRNTDITEDDYNRVIHAKTAILFSAAAQLGVMMLPNSDDLQTRMASYGLHLGMAFQVIDDVLDYTADPETSGKNIGDDLAEGKVTLPVIHALSKASKSERELMEQAINDPNKANIQDMLSILKTHDSCEYAINKAKEYSEQATRDIDGLHDSPHQQAMYSLAQFAVNRDQ